MKKMLQFKLRCIERDLATLRKDRDKLTFELAYQGRTYHPDLLYMNAWVRVYENASWILRSVLLELEKSVSEYLDDFMDLWNETETQLLQSCEEQLAA